MPDPAHQVSEPFARYGHHWSVALLQQCEAWGLRDKQPLLGVAVRRSLGRACSIWDPLVADPSTRIRSGYEEVVTQQNDEKESPGTPQDLQGDCRDVFWNGHRCSIWRQG